MSNLAVASHIAQASSLRSSHQEMKPQDKDSLAINQEVTDQDAASATKDLKYMQ